MCIYYICMTTSLCTPANVHDNTVCICGVLCGEIDGLILCMQTNCTLLSLINNIARHCISHNNTTVWVVDLQNSIILSVNVPHNTV